MIAELKFASPFRGVIRTRSEARNLAREWLPGDVPRFPSYRTGLFCGSGNDIRVVRTPSEVPVLRKDFIIDDRQLDETLVMGADAVLLLAGS